MVVILNHIREPDHGNLNTFNDHSLLRFERANDYRNYHYNTRKAT